MQARTMPPASRSHRGLSTARAALQVVWMLAGRPDGVRADEVADALGKSLSTAYNVLASLCDEGVAAHDPRGVYRLAPAFQDLISNGRAPVRELHDLTGVVIDLLARTHKRSYLGVLRAGRLDIVLERGLQGMPKLPGLKPEIGDAAHALALGKVVLAFAPHDTLERFLRRGLGAFTEHTIADPALLQAELSGTRRDGYAVEREEFGVDLCGIAAPILDERGRFVAAIAVSMTRRAFDDEREALVRSVVGAARAAGRSSGPLPLELPVGGDRLRFQPSAETRWVLDSKHKAGLASAPGSTRAVSAACAR
jgi:DNA-binding IclR family transcriptional regulator